MNQTLQQRHPPVHNFYVHHLPTAPADLRQEVLDGLSRPIKQLPPKLFYDERGSQLFDAITELPEYYPTRTEAGIFRQFEGEICDAIAPGAILIEPGSGSCQKVRPLLTRSQAAAYVPVEISASHLVAAARDLAHQFPNIAIHAVCADFTQARPLPTAIPAGPRVAFFPGSTIGNFEPAAAVTLLRALRGWLNHQGSLLIGVDTKKDPDLLNAAYNDAQGVTAEFNRNMLHHLNKTLNASFVPEHFAHDAFFNEELGRIEMHLRSLRDQRVRVADRWIEFAAGESIHTENSYKYHPDEFARLATEAGFIPRHCWQDRAGLFSVHWLTL